MAAMAASRQLHDVFLSSVLDGTFTDEEESRLPVPSADLEPMIDALSRHKTDLEGQVHAINEETGPEVASWIRNAKTLQEDIFRSKTIANDIVRQSEAPDVSGEDIEDAEEKVEFLNREAQYSQQLSGALKAIKRVNQLLSEAEKASCERRILDSLHLLQNSWAALDNVEVSKTCRVMKQLDLRAFELKSDVHEIFNHVWKELIQVDIDGGKFAIYDALNEESFSLPESVIGLKAYKEMDERMEQLWRNLDAAIVAPRMDSRRTTIQGVAAETDLLRLAGQTDPSIDALLSDLETVLTFVAKKLPEELLQSLCGFMMSDVIPRLIREWLNPAVPTSLKDMGNFESMIQKTKNFCAALDQSGYTGFEELTEWADKAPTIWLGKCRETALDSVRAKLNKGIGKSKQVEKIEKHMVSISEGNELATAGAGATADTTDWGADWGDAWDEEDNGPEDRKPKAGIDTKTKGQKEDDGADAWGWDENDAADKHAEADTTPEEKDLDESAEAWGWGDDDAAPESDVAPPPAKRTKQNQEQTRELILKETYNISAMPEPVLELISAILEDGATLTKEGDEYAHVAATAPGLFSLPTFALALFRAISPHYYSLDVGGNMFLYNDAMYLAEKLSDFSISWKQRSDLTKRAQNMLRLDNDIKSLQSFANRSYAAEMNIQKTILRDLLGGSQSILQQDETEAAVESGVARIRSMAATWQPILARSVLSQAVGSLADALASKLITDVLEMNSIGQDEAFRIANLIASATELDDLFLLGGAGGGAGAGADGEDEVPSTSQYAPNWLRLKYLSEVLQSNLNEVRYLWVESELSLYFTTQEVVDLIRASFEDNPRTRETVRDVQAKPRPLG